MVSYIGDFDPKERCESTCKILHNEWNKLKEEFPKIKEAKIPFIIVSHGEWLDMIWDILIKEPSNRKSSNLIETIKSNLDGDYVMSTFCNGITHNGDLLQLVKMYEETLVRNLYLCQRNYDGLLNHFKMALRHEAGHVLSNMEILCRHNGDYATAIKELNMLIDQTNEEIDQLLEDYKGHQYDEIFYKRYYSTPMESMANNMVGLTYMDMMDPILLA